MAARSVATAGVLAVTDIGGILPCAPKPAPEIPPRRRASRRRDGGINRRLRRLVAGLAPLRPARIRGGVVLGSRVYQRDDLVLDRLDPVGGLDPLGAVPLHGEHAVVAIVVTAGDAERRREA